MLRNVPDALVGLLLSSEASPARGSVPAEEEVVLVTPDGLAAVGVADLNWTGL